MIPRILVIRGGAIGDFILTLPSIRLLREAFPSAVIEILGYRHIVSIAEGRYYADASRSIEYGPLAGFFSRNGALAPDLVEYFSQFQQVISYLYDPDGIFAANIARAGVKHFLSAYRPLDDSEHATYQLARPLQELALYLEGGAPRIFPLESDREAAASFLGGFAGKQIVAIHPGSGSAKKNWSLDRWEALGREVCKSGTAEALILVGGEADLVQLEQLTKDWAGLPLLVASGQPLPYLGAILEKCALFIGHDSGISHLAAASGVSCTLLFGPTDPSIWAPANERVEVIQAPEGDLSRLSSSEVFGRVRLRLG